MRPSSASFSTPSAAHSSGIQGNPGCLNGLRPTTRAPRHHPLKRRSSSLLQYNTDHHKTPDTPRTAHQRKRYPACRQGWGGNGAPVSPLLANQHPHLPTHRATGRRTLWHGTCLWDTGGNRALVRGVSPHNSEARGDQGPSHQATRHTPAGRTGRTTYDPEKL